MNEVILWSTISAICWFLFAWAIAKIKKDGFHIGVLFCLLFIITYPLKLIATEKGFSYLNSHHLGPEWQLKALLISNLCGLFFIIPILVTKRKGIINNEENEFRHSATIWFCGFLFFLVMTYGIDSFTRIFSFEKLTELRDIRNASRAGNSLSGLCSHGILICLAMYFKSIADRIDSMGWKNKIKLIILWCPIIYVLIAISGSKLLALTPPAIFFVMYNMNKKIKNGKGITFNRVFLLIVLGLVGVAITGTIRQFGQYGQNFDVLRSFWQIIYAFDSVDNLAYILSRAHSIWSGDLNFQPTIQYIFQSPIPRFIWPDKPLVLGNMYIMQNYLPEKFTDAFGEVISPSMPGEMILSGGIPFMVIWAFILGLLFAFVYNRSHRNINGVYWKLAYMFLVLNLFSMLRSGTGIVYPFILYCLIMIFIFIIRSFIKGAVTKELSSSKRRFYTLKRDL